MQNKKTKIILGAIAALFVIVFAVIFVYSNKRDQKERVGQDKNIVVPAHVLSPEEEAALQGQMSEIIKSKDFNRCNELGDPTYRAVCVNNIALNFAQETQDISYCQKMDNILVTINDCERQIIFAKAVKKGDVAACYETRDAGLQKQCKESFELSFAIKKKDGGLCGKIVDPESREYCYIKILVNNNPTAVKNFDCNQFSQENSRLDCKSYLESGIGKALEDCKRFKTESFAKACALEHINGNK